MTYKDIIQNREQVLGKKTMEERMKSIQVVLEGILDGLKHRNINDAEYFRLMGFVKEIGGDSIEDEPA